MFAVFPSDLRPSAANAVVPPPGYRSDIPLVARSSHSDISSTAPSTPWSYRTVGTLRYPGALPTSGINPVIVEGRPMNRLSGYNAPDRTPSNTDTASRTILSPTTRDNVVGPPEMAQFQLSSSPAPQPNRRGPLVVPSLTRVESEYAPAKKRQAVDRVAFSFSQLPKANEDETEHSCEVLLKDMKAFESWIKQQQSLQQWRRQESVALKEDAERSRKRYHAKPKDPTKKARGQYKVKEKHKASQRITYLCDHARAPEKGQGEGQIRFDLEPSIKVGCTARMTVHELDDRTVRVKVDGSHRNYDPRSAESIIGSRLPISVRSWIDARVEEGMSPQAIYEHIMISEASMAEYEECDSDDDHAIDELPMLYSFRVHMDYIRSRVRWFNEVRRRPTGSDGKTLSDLDAASATLQENIDGGGWGLAVVGKAPSGEDFDVVAFASKWQLQILRKYSGTVMMDATHNVIKGFRGKSLYLYTLVVKNKTTQRGTPVAFMMSESSSQRVVANDTSSQIRSGSDEAARIRYPVALFLSQLFVSDDAPVRGHTPHTLLIDCSRAEQAAITFALPSTKVLYCHYHFWKAINGQLDKKVGKGMPNSPLHMQRDNARSLIRRMVRSSTETEFDEAWGDAQRAWSAQGPKWKGFLDYFVIQWHYQADEWAGYSRKYEHSGVDTNNYLESWHQKLKRNYMKKRNLKMPDVIAMLLHEILPLFRFAHLRVALKFAKASLTKAERRNRHTAMQYSETDLALCINIVEAEQKIQVRSMQQPSTFYEVRYKVDQEVITPIKCTCPSFAFSHDRCKHIFLVQRYMRKLRVTAPVNRSESASEHEKEDGLLVKDLRTVSTVSSNHTFPHNTLQSQQQDEESEQHASIRRTQSKRVVQLEAETVFMPEIRFEDGEDTSRERLTRIGDHHDDNDDAFPTASQRMPSYSPPPLHFTQQEDRHRAEGKALQMQFNELVEALYHMSIRSPLAERHDQERMRDMIAEVQAMIPTWQEAIGQREAGAAQRRA